MLIEVEPDAVGRDAKVIGFGVGAVVSVGVLEVVKFQVVLLVIPAKPLLARSLMAVLAIRTA
jgi:hypothetical protein